MDNNANIELLRGHMDTIILCTLMPGDKYGLEILREIQDSSQELYMLKQPTLYSALKRLTVDGLISAYDGDVSNGRKRVYYSLTDDGRKYVTNDQLQWEFSRTIMDKLISDKIYDPIMNDRPFDPSEFRPLTKRSKPKSHEFDLQNQDMQNSHMSASTQEDCLDNSSVDTFEAENAPVSQPEKLPCGVTSGAISSSPYNIESVIPQNLPPQPVKVANTDKAGDRFFFSDVVSPELTKRELLDRQAYHDVPARLDSLYDKKFEKPTITVASNPKPNMPNKQFSFSDTANNNQSVINDIDRKTAANMLYSHDLDIDTNHKNSEFPESLTHYDLDIKPKNSNIRNKDAALGTDARTDHNNTQFQHITMANDVNADKSATAPKYVQKNYQADGSAILPSHIPTEEKSVNYISTLGNIFNTSKLQPPVAENSNRDLYTYDQNVKASAKPTAKPNVSQSKYVEDMNLAKLKSKLYEEDVTLKQYIKSETSNYYVNKYFYANRILRDWSYIVYAIFALFCIVCYTSTIAIKGNSLGAFLGFFFAGAALPIFATIKWYMNKSARKLASFSFAHAIVTGAILLLIALIPILSISFFAIKINISDVKTLINPLILPLIALLMIPIDITIYSLLYNSKRYHLR